MTYKRNAISLLTRKIFELAEPEFCVKNFKLLDETLITNGYTMKLIKGLNEATIENSTFLTKIAIRFQMDCFKK